MRSFLGAAILVAAAAIIPSAFHSASAGSVPCEDLLKDLRAAEQGAQISAGDAAKVKGLEDKGIERCNADDDARADEFFTQALKILGK